MHTRRESALEQAKREVRTTGGEIQVVGQAGEVTSYRLLPGSPSPWFDAVVPVVLLVLPALLSSLLGPLAPGLFAPAILSSDGSVLGVALATSVLSAAAAVTTGLTFLAGDEMTLPAFLFLAAVSLVVANVVASLLGTGGLDFLAYRPSWMPAIGGPLIFAEIVLLFLAAGFVTYGVGGALLGLAAGIVAGWRFAAWWLYRAVT